MNGSLLRLILAVSVAINILLIGGLIYQSRQIKYREQYRIARLVRQIEAKANGNYAEMERLATQEVRTLEKAFKDAKEGFGARAKQAKDTLRKTGNAIENKVDNVIETTKAGAQEAQSRVKNAAKDLAGSR